MRRATVAAVAFLTVLSAFAGGNQWPTHLSAITLASSGFTLTAKVPAGWSTEDGQVLPPPAFRSACHVHAVFYRDRDWNRTLAIALGTDDASRAREKRTLSRVGGHRVVQNRFMDASGRTILNVYIDLEDLTPGGISVWSFDGTNTPEGRRCEHQFGTFIQTAAIKLEPDADPRSIPPTQ